VVQKVVTVTSIPFPVTPSPIIQVSSGNGDHFGPVMSADGRFVTYDPDGAIFLYDRQTNTTNTIATAGNGFTYTAPTISSDGHYIVYQGSNGTQFVFIYDNNPSDAGYQHTTQLFPGSSPAIDGNGGIIVVENGGSSIGVYDQQGHAIATITAAAIGSSGTVWKPAISADGHVIAFWTSDSATVGGSGHLFTYNLSTGAIAEIASTATGAGTTAASISADGRYVVYESDASGGHSEIYLYDLTTAHVVFHTANAAGASHHPVISPDGHFIIFASDAHLTSSDTNTVADTYVVDVTDPSNPVYKLVSVLADGTQGNAASDLGGAISAGAQFYAFGSNASTFSTGNASGVGQIFVVDPTSGHSAIIQESANSPPELTASGVIQLTGASGAFSISVSDPTGTLSPSELSARFSAVIVIDPDHPTDPKIDWTFKEQKSDFASLTYGQSAIQYFVITLSSDGGSTTIPVKVSVFDADQPTITVVDVAPVATPAALAAGTEDTAYTINASDLLAGVTDVDGPSLLITAVSVASGGGAVVDNHDGTFTYTPALHHSGPVSFNYTASDGTLTSSSTASLTLANIGQGPVVTTTSDAFIELAGTGNATADTASGTISFTDVDLADRPVVNTSFASFTYRDAQHNDITSSVTAAQLADVLAVRAPLTVTPSEGNTNNGSATWTYSLADNKFDFLAAGETLTLTYTAQVDDGRGDTVTTPLTVTITGANDAPVLAAGSVTSATIDVPVANTGTSTLSPGVAAQLDAPGLISGLGGHTGFGTLALPAGDDNSSGAINFTSVFGSAGLDFFGTSYTSLFVNNNGNITFRAPSSTFTPATISAGLNNPIIAPFWADVDTRGHGAVYYDLDSADGVMTITWDNVGYYSFGTNKLDSFQLVLINEGNGNFDIEYRYGNIQWTTGSASGGSNGLGGTPAHAGYSAGDGVHSFELPQSGNQAALLALPTTAGNTGIAGVDEFNVRNGEVGPSTLTSTGTINFSDPDLSDSHTIQSVNYTGGGNELGTLSLTQAADTTGTGAGGQFVWTYTASAETVRNALDSISTHTKVETFDVVISDGHGGTLRQTVSVTLNETGVPSSNAAPVIATDHFTVNQNPDGTTTVAGLSVSDANASPTETFTINAVTAGAGSGSSITPSTNSGHLTDINAALTTGVVYHPGPTPPQTDKVTLTAADSFGATDTVNFIFNEAGTGPTTTLVGTGGKDVIFATGHQDILTGGGGQDQFVFKPSSGTTDVQHTITDFVAGLDKIDVRQFNNISSLADAPETQQGNDTLITLDSHETLLLKNVIATNLHSSDFIISPHVA
jgi:VCBS repeat-containing protein